MAGGLRAAVDGLLAVLLAPRCAVCDAPLEAPSRVPVCPACWTGVHLLTPPVCARCGDPLPSWRVISRSSALCPRCRRRPATIDRGGAAGLYDGPLRGIIHALKYGGRRSLAGPLGQLMAAQGRDLLAGADGVVPVPIHPRRRRVRGFNQASALARAVGLPVCEVLVRTRSTPAQTDLPASQRHRNVRGAFGLRGGWWSDRTRRRIRGRVLVLIDDVSTTGATLDACARVLKAAGAREVRALTVAKVVLRPR
jgi:ComF family protein